MPTINVSVMPFDALQCQWQCNLELMEYVGKMHILDDHVLTMTVGLTQTCLNKMYIRFQFHLTIM